MSRSKEITGWLKGPGQGWEICVKSTMRWRKGPQFGTQNITIPYVIDEDGSRHYQEPVHGPWTWYNWRLKRIEGPKVDLSPKVVISSNSLDGVTSVGIELQEGEVRSTFIPNKTNPPSL